MAIKKVIRMGHPVLRQIAKELTPDEILSQTTKELVEDLVDTMKHEGGIGIAAPQIGVSKQVAIIELDPENERYKEITKQLTTSGKFIIFNPKIEYLTQQMQGYWEGCLSVPGLRGFVQRPAKVKVNYLDQFAKEQSVTLDEFLATVFQHELDHLFGKLYIDRITDSTMLSYIEEFDQFIVKADQNPSSK